ncbi:sensor histidine kinase [Spirosoma sp. KCTC 42546]|uniref:sensor histidine kinase n=1 Tax=Spirosoma sp. KCTC 42546 TaxID=2520506 RepID=UPI001159A4C5|nr:histidine kinase [Spirosoma sp. KCTC 42546]QDK78386.1 sensor histidine kinase [Spirosoma sp. KCTC 42546]
MNVSFYSKLNQSWFFRYKIYHLPFWFVYHYLWWIVTLGNPVKVFYTIVVLPYALKYGFYVIFQAIAVYFNLYFLIPKYLEQNRFTLYISYLLLTILCTTLCIVGGYYFSAYASGRSIADLFGQSACFNSFLSNALPSTVASTTLAMSIKLTKNWIQASQRQQLLEKEKLETELKFLRNQFNPHFLFNTINSIFFLIHKNPDMASASLAKFSELLRYQLYECNDQQIPLGKEIAYVENFFELEKLRQSSNVVITFNHTPTFTDHLGIAPFILMTFVENAFKHVSRHSTKPNWITIKLELDGQQLDFVIANSASPDAANEVVKYGGIGLTNVQRRLDLLYPGQHELAIHQDPDQFEVKLRLTLTELVQSSTLQIA